MSQDNKYIYENFYDLINSENDTENINQCDNNICLISYDKLLDNNIILSCGHKFNYFELFNEVKYQKTNRQYDNYKLKINDIRCPYCRQITNYILPYYKYYNLEKIIGVNWPEKYSIHNYDNNINKNYCQHLKCNNIGCVSELTKKCFCNKHTLYTQNQEYILLSQENKIKYNKLSKLKVEKLKEIIKTNKLKKSGIKEQLINFIILNISDIDDYIN